MTKKKQSNFICKIQLDYSLQKQLSFWSHWAPLLYPFALHLETQSAVGLGVKQLPSVNDQKISNYNWQWERKLILHLRKLSRAWSDEAMQAIKIKAIENSWNNLKFILMRCLCFGSWLWVLWTIFYLYIHDISSS